MRILLTLSLSTLLATHAPAEVIMGWDNDPTVHGSESWASTYAATGINAATVTTGSGIAAKLTSGGPAADQAMKYTGLHARNMADAVTNNEYISFTLSSTSDAFEVSSIEFSDVNMNVGSTLMMELRSSVDGFTTTLSSNSTTNAAAEGIENFPTSGIYGLSNVDFRLYLYWVENGNENSSIHFRSDKTSIDQFPDAASTTLTDPILLVNGTVFFAGIVYITDFSATPDNFIDSDSVQLAWTTAQAKRLEISDGTSTIATYTTSVDGQSFINSGSLALGTVTETTTYTLTATYEESGSGDTTTEQSIVTVIPTTDVDTDRDGLSDAEEVDTYSTDPDNPDTDGDGTPDGLEVARGLDPKNPNESLDRPNIIFFFTDDQGWGDLGCFWQDQRTGTQKFDTPVLDSLAAEGAKMTHHYVAAPICLPSRSSFLQGRHQGHSNLRNLMFDNALDDNHTIADTLRRAGYRTIHIGKNGVAGKEDSVSLSGTGSENLAAHPLKRGFDEYFGYLFHTDAHEHYPRNGTSNKTAHVYHNYRQITDASPDLYTTDAWTAFAKDAITREATDGDNQPFFLYLAYDAPHFNNQRPAVPYPTGGGLNGGIQWTTAADGSGNTRYASTADGTGMIDGYDHPDNDPSWDTTHKQVAGMIRRIDNSIGDIKQLLVDLGIDDNTLIVFTTDNGPDSSSRDPRYFESYANFEGTKQDILEGGIRVPTVVRWPGHIAGATGDENNIHEISRPAITYDWMPTFAEMAGVTAPAWCDGVSLLPTLTGEGTQRDKGYLYIEFKGYGGTVSDWTEFPNHRGETRGQTQAVRIGNYMGIRMDIAGADDPFQIYDVTTDPGQGSNLVASMPDLQQKMHDIALQTRRPLSGAARPYDSAPVPDASRELEPGLNYTSHEGIWSYVPEFRDIPSSRRGETETLNLSVRSRDTHVGLLFTGYIEIPTAGDYTFHLLSDTGANLFLHDAHLIDDDFKHDGSEQSGTATLEAGLHPFRLYYRHGTAANYQLDLSWEGPGIAKQIIPAASYFRIPKISATIDHDGDSLNFQWNSLNGQSYRIRANDSLSEAQPSWEILKSGVTGTPPQNSLSIPKPAADRMFYVIEEESEIATRVMQRHGIPTDDLHALTKGFAGKFSVGPHDVHFTAEGYRHIASQVAASIAAELPETQAIKRKSGTAR